MENPGSFPFLKADIFQVYFLFPLPQFNHETIKTELLNYLRTSPFHFYDQHQKIYLYHTFSTNLTQIFVPDVIIAAIIKGFISSLSFLDLIIKKD